MKDIRSKEHECGKFTSGENKETKLKHLKECKADMMKKIEEIDAAIRKLE